MHQLKHVHFFQSILALTSCFANVINLQPSSHHCDLASPECGRAGRGLESAQGLQANDIKRRDSNCQAIRQARAAQKADTRRTQQQTHALTAKFSA